MIVGIGTDMVEIARITAMIERYGDAARRRFCTGRELLEARERGDSPLFFAGRWAAKEAVSKALGCGIGKDCIWQDINISNTSQGNPELTLTGRTAAKAAALQARYFHISISHEREYACAMIILES